MFPYTSWRLERGGLGQVLDEFLVRVRLDVGRVLARQAAQLHQDGAFGVPSGVCGSAFQEREPFVPALGHRRLHGEGEREGPVGGGHVRVAAEEGQRALDDRVRVDAHVGEDVAEPFAVVGAVGEDDIGAGTGEQAVDHLLVDDSDVAGDGDGPLGARLPTPDRGCARARAPYRR